MHFYSLSSFPRVQSSSIREMSVWQAKVCMNNPRLINVYTINGNDFFSRVLFLVVMKDQKLVLYFHILNQIMGLVRWVLSLFNFRLQYFWHLVCPQILVGYRWKSAVLFRHMYALCIPIFNFPFNHFMRWWKMIDCQSNLITRPSISPAWS